MKFIARKIITNKLIAKFFKFLEIKEDDQTETIWYSGMSYNIEPVSSRSLYIFGIPFISWCKRISYDEFNSNYGNGEIKRPPVTWTT